jgi:hypothetical protein
VPSNCVLTNVEALERANRAKTYAKGEWEKSDREYKRGFENGDLYIVGDATRRASESP